MPKYMDHHKGTVTLPPEVAKQMVEGIKAGSKNALGVKGLNSFFAKDETWCLTEAPNADAVCKTHEGMGIKIGVGDVKEVQTLV